MWLINMITVAPMMPPESTNIKSQQKRQEGTCSSICMHFNLDCDQGG